MCLDTIIYEVYFYYYYFYFYYCTIIMLSFTFYIDFVICMRLTITFFISFNNNFSHLFHILSKIHVFIFIFLRISSHILLNYLSFTLCNCNFIYIFLQTHKILYFLTNILLQHFFSLYFKIYTFYNNHIASLYIIYLEFLFPK